ncbi:unnamed protein product, partial [Closterium sp. Naga37s-1]
RCRRCCECSTDTARAAPPTSPTGAWRGVPITTACIATIRPLLAWRTSLRGRLSCSWRTVTVIVVPILRHPVPENASPEQLRESVSPTAWANLCFLEIEIQQMLTLLANGSSTSAYSFAMHDTADPEQPIQVLGPESLRVESGTLYPYVLPGPVVPYPKHIEPFPEDLLGRKYEAQCRFEGPYPKWDLVYAPMLLGLLVLLVAVLLSTMIAVLAWKKRNLEEAMKEIQLCTAILERSPRGRGGLQLQERQHADLVDARACAGETIDLINQVLDLAKLQAASSLPLSPPLPLASYTGMIEELLESRLEEWQVADLRDARACVGMIEELLECSLEEWQVADLQDARACAEELLDSQLEEWQVADLRDARACAGETVEIINRVLDLAKLQAGWLQLETLPCCLRRIVREATTSAMNSTATGHIAIRLWCISPQHSEASASKRPPPSADAATTGTTQASSSEPPPASSAWHQLGACVRRFPPTCLLCLPRRRPPSQEWSVFESTQKQTHPPPTWLLCLPQHRPATQGGPVGNGARQECGKACSRDDVGNAGERQDGDGRLEGEVREWVEGACAAREEGEWLVVVACEDTGGGIPPEELRWVLDPHGLAGHSSHDMHGNGQNKVMERVRSRGRADPWKGLGRSASLQRDRKAAAGPRWTPYPVRFLLSTSLVAEMGGDMAVLSDASTGTTILLALPLGGGEGSSSSGSWEGSGKETGELGGAGEQRVGREGGSQGGNAGPASAATILPHAAAAAAAAQPDSQQRQTAGARALVHARTFPQAEMDRAAASGECGKGAGEAEELVRAILAGRGVAVVDDNAVNRMVVRRTLQGYGAHVLLLPSGEEALQALSSAFSSPTPSSPIHVLHSAPEAPHKALSSATPSPPIHLLLLDLHMPPGIDG